MPFLRFKKQQLTALCPPQWRMDAKKFACDDLHRMGDSATGPMGLPCGALAALLVLAGRTR